MQSLLFLLRILTFITAALVLMVSPCLSSVSTSLKEVFFTLLTYECVSWMISVSVFCPRLSHTSTLLFSLLTVSLGQLAWKLLQRTSTMQINASWSTLIWDTQEWRKKWKKLWMKFVENTRSTWKYGSHENMVLMKMAVKVMNWRMIEVDDFGGA